MARGVRSTLLSVSRRCDCPVKEMVASGRDADEKGEKITGRKLEVPDNGHPPVTVDDARTQKRKLP